MSVATVVVGSGDASQLWLPTLREHPLCDLRALVDVDLEKARRNAAAHRLECRVEGDLAAALAATSARLVIDLTTPENRVAIARLAFEHGCDLFCEKPLALTLDAGCELVELAAASGRRCAVMQNRRFHPGMRALRAAAEGGALGELTIVTADFFKPVEPDARLAAMRSPLIADMAIHTFDQARYLVGRAPIRVRAHEWNPAGSPFRGDAAAVCLFEFEGGTVFSYRGSWVATGQESTWYASWRLLGTRGTASWDGDGVPSCELAAGRGPDGVLVEPHALPAGVDRRTEHPGAIDALFRGLVDGAPFETDCADNIRSLAMMTAALESSQSGGWVDVPQP